MEVWDIYDKDRDKTGKCHVRGNPLAMDEYQIVGHGFIERCLNNAEKSEESNDVQKYELSLKQQGFKTEEAFCKVLGLEGKDPYESLLTFGRYKGDI